MWDEYNEQLGRLIALASAGSIEAFEELYHSTARWLLSHVRRIVDDEQAEDVLAEAFIHIWKTIGSYDRSRAVPAVWLSMIVRSRGLDYLRREKRQRVADRDESQVPDAATDEEYCPEHVLSRLQQRRLVQLSLACLSETEQRVVGLAYFSECSLGEIAATTGLAFGSVKFAMASAQQKLRKHLGITTP